MSYVSYDSTKLIPAPLVTFGHEWPRSEDGSRVGRRLRITLSGTFVSGRGGLHSGSGYPADVPTDRHCMRDILTKQEDVVALFENTDYAWFEIMPDPEATSTPTKYIVKVVSIDFPDGSDNQWTETTDYVIQLDAQLGDDADDTESITDYDETWELQYNEDPNDTYGLIHSIRCTSKEQYIVALSNIKEGWQKAYDYVNNDLGGPGIDNSIVQADPGLNLAVSFIGYNHVLTKTIDEYSGVYNIQETWLMSETTYAEDQQIDVKWDRDIADELPHTTVTINGTITGLRNDGGTGYANAQARWAIVEAGLYSQANAAVSGTTIRSTPKTTQITYDEFDRIITYSYQYDNGTEDYNHNQTITISTGDSDCNKITAQVTGSVTGVKTDSATAWDNAQVGWAVVKTSIYSDATSAYGVYGGAGALRVDPSEHREVYGIQDGVISYSYTYHDWDTAYVHEQTIESNFDKTSDHGGVTVRGSIVAWCADGYSEAESYFNSTWSESQAYAAGSPYYTGSHSLASGAKITSVAYDEFNRQVTYSYEFDDYDNSVDVDVSYTVETDPQQCGYNVGRIEGSITGKAAGGSSAWSNAKTEYDGTWKGADPSLISTYLPGANLVSQSTTHNEFNNRITFSFQYNDQDNKYIIDENISRTYGPEDCGYETIVQSGTVTGLCDGTSGSAIANAELGLLAVVPPTGIGVRTKQSVSRNDSQGIIQYTYEFTSRATPYIIDQTSTEQDILERVGRTVTYSGSVTGLCTGDPPSTSVKYDNASVGWGVHEPTIDPASDYTGTWTKRVSSIGRNENTGVINFNIEYQEKGVCVSGALEESIDITIERPTDIFAIASILGGPSIIQDKEGTTVSRKIVSVTAKFEPTASCGLGGTPNLDTLVDGEEPSADVVVLERDTEMWNPRTGNFQRTKAWVYTDCP